LYRIYFTIPPAESHEQKLFATKKKRNISGSSRLYRTVVAVENMAITVFLPPLILFNPETCNQSNRDKIVLSKHMSLKVEASGGGQKKF